MFCQEPKQIKNSYSWRRCCGEDLLTRYLKPADSWLEWDTNELKPVTTTALSGLCWHMSWLCHCSKRDPVEGDNYIPAQTHQGFRKWNLGHSWGTPLILHSFSFPPCLHADFLATQSCPQSLQCGLAPLTFFLLNAHVRTSLFLERLLCCYSMLSILRIWLL